jgi:hypothetical protein
MFAAHIHHSKNLRTSGTIPVTDCRVSVLEFATLSGVLDRASQVISFRSWLSRKLYLWSCRIHEDWHEVELISSNGERIEFCCYGDFVGSWPEGWEFTCSCAQRTDSN